MIILADESVDLPIIKSLRNHSFDVLAICEERPSISDDEVLKLANAGNRILLTADKDFGELVFRLNSAHAGVVLIRLSGMKPQEKSHLVVNAFLNLGESLIDSFTVIQSGLIRSRKRK